jgi:hypothetical protein
MNNQIELFFICLFVLRVDFKALNGMEGNEEEESFFVRGGHQRPPTFS